MYPCLQCIVRFAFLLILFFSCSFCSAGHSAPQSHLLPVPSTSTMSCPPSPLPCPLPSFVSGAAEPTEFISASSPVSAGPFPRWVFVEAMGTFRSRNGEHSTPSCGPQTSSSVFTQVLLSTSKIQPAPWGLRFLVPPRQPQTLSPWWLFLLPNDVKGFVLSPRMNSVL